jgi:hypothetical protein
LEGIAARLQKLQAQLDRRREKKQEIIDLQVKLAVNEAEGLGFFSQSSGRGMNVDVHMPVDMTFEGETFGPPMGEIPIGAPNGSRSKDAVPPEPPQPPAPSESISE